MHLHVRFECRRHAIEMRAVYRRALISFVSRVARASRLLNPLSALEVTTIVSIQSLQSFNAATIPSCSLFPFILFLVKGERCLYLKSTIKLEARIRHHSVKRLRALLLYYNNVQFILLINLRITIQINTSNGQM